MASEYRDPTPEDIQRLLDIGLTADEMRRVAEILQFMVTLAEAGDTDAHVHTGISEEKMREITKWFRTLRIEP